VTTVDIAQERYVLTHQENVARAQDESHADGHDYDKGSPHLRHRQLRSMVHGRLRALVSDALAREGRCRVLEIGAGHGTFTSMLVEAGATVTVTETSRASAGHLHRAFSGDDAVTVVHDATGEAILASDELWDLVVIISVLHHIPDYLDFLDRLVHLMAPAGALFTVQDPLYYPRMSRIAHASDRAAYLTWRLFQGDYGRGVRTRLRRLRGAYVDTEPSDLVEYHVVRDGVDEEAIRSLLDDRFETVEVFRYWSSQAPLWQRLGQLTRLRTTFGVQASHRISDDG
jgi:protein-L-isoaspartate O-methyltransferase